MARPKTNKKKCIIKSYAKLCKKLRRYPNILEFCEATPYTKDMIKHHVGSLKNLKQEARKFFPGKFSNILDDSIFNVAAVKALKTKVKKHKRFIITTAVTGCPVDSNFLKSINNYCKIKDAKMLVLIASDPAAKTYSDFVDSAIPRENIVVSDISLNSNIHINTIKISAKHIDPVTSLTRIGQRTGSFLYASPKQRLKYVATGNLRHSHAVMTTGAVTIPKYDTDRYMSNRTAHIAKYDHVMGAIIVEIEDDKYYHFRQVQADNDGSFIDLGKKYTTSSVEDCPPEAFVLGDWHSGETDPDVARCWKEISKLLKPKRILLHDVFNGMSINHHEERNIILRAQRANRGRLNLEEEFLGLIKDLNELTTWTDEVVIIKSNHDEFLENYLKECKYKYDPYNHRFSLLLAYHMLDGKDPIKTGVESFNKLKRSHKIKWLKRDDDYMIARIQLGAHGDKGPNGSKGNIKSMENSYGNCVTAHRHSPEILRGAWVVGTSTYLKLDYNQGPSSWLNTGCLIYPNGSRQLINVIDKKWRIK